MTASGHPSGKIKNLFVESARTRRVLLAGVSATAILCALPVFANEIIDNGDSKTIAGGTPDSPWDIVGDLTVGNVGEGNLIISNAGVVTNNVSHVGLAAGSNGTVTIQGSGSRWTTNGVVNIGDAGTGKLIINGGAYTSVNYDGNVYFLIGNGATGNGTVEVSGVDALTGERSSLITNNRIYVGNAGNGRLAVTDGGLVSAQYTSAIGETGSGTGIVNVSGVNAATGFRSTFHVVNNQLWIGDEGQGSLNVSDGGLVQVADGIGIGWGGHSVGQMIVSGINQASGDHSTVEATSIRVGHGAGGAGAIGALAVTDGGVVTNVTGMVGYFAGSQGTAVVDGVNSKWSNAGELTVGYAGNGTTFIQNGGSVSSDLGFIGRNAGSSGLVKVDGVGSTWTSTDALGVGTSLQVGLNGSGTLTISNGGAVTATTVSMATNGAASGSINIGSAVGDAAVAPGVLAAGTLTLGAGKGHLVFNHTDMSGNYAFAPVITGGNDASAVDVYSGDTVLTGAGSDYTAATSIHGGILSAGAADVFSTVSDFTVGAAGTLALKGHDQTLASLSNAGHVDFGGSGGTTLTVAGDYTGNGGTMTINTVLGDDGSLTDRLHVDGATSGTTGLRVINRNGMGAQTVNGIEVVEVTDQSNGSFSLIGDYVTKDGQQAVVGGAYAYTLQQGSGSGNRDGNWYLTSQLAKPIEPVDPTDPVNPVNPDCEQTDTCPVPPPRYSAGVPVYEGYLQNMQALNRLPTLQQRVGERYRAGREGDGQAKGAVVDDKGVWARVEGAHSRLEPATSTTRIKQDVNTVTMQAGIDGLFHDGADGRLIAGITGQYGHARGNISSFYGDGDITTDAWSLGATATWYGNNGFYLDGQSQVTWFDSDLSSRTANAGLADGRKATGYAMSLEAGQRFAVSQDWSVTPQAQLMYSSINADAFHDTWRSRVSLHDGDNLTGRLGLAASYASNWKGADGLDVNSSVYGIANLFRDFMGGSSVHVSGVAFDTDGERTRGGIGAGGSYSWANNKYAVYGEGSIDTALRHFGDNYSLKGNLGFYVKW